MKIPINLCLFTTTKGHWGIKTRYKETIEYLNAQIPIRQFANAIAHIKYADDNSEDEQAFIMKKDFENIGFKVIMTAGKWGHNSESHQIEYIKDIYKVFCDKRVQSVPYSLFLEDDMKIVVRQGELENYLFKATNILETDPDIVSVRIARGANEKERILRLREKHGIDSHVAPAPRGYESSYFLASDFSNNPHICRSRDIRNAMIMIQNIQGIPLHSEHGTAIGLKFFSLSKTPIAIFNPQNIVARHIGTPLGEEEPLDKDIELT
jgi:hypothetical protein